MKKKRIIAVLAAFMCCAGNISVPDMITVDSAETAQEDTSQTNDTVTGDCNNDGKLSISDLVLLQRFLLAEEVDITNWKAADLCEDNRLDVFDLCLMKEALIKEMNIDDSKLSELLAGYYDANYNKPLPSARIALKCKSFIPLGEKLTVDVATSDGAFHPQDYDSNRVYEYGIFPTEGYKQIKDENLIVNGENGEYKKEYAGEEMQVFDIDAKYDDYDTYHHETAEIDFKNYKAGSSGCITFSFIAIFADDPQNPSTEGMQQSLRYYVGDKGATISNLGVEDAKEKYQDKWGAISDAEDTDPDNADLSFGYYDANYNKPLPSARIESEYPTV